MFKAFKILLLLIGYSRVQVHDFVGLSELYYAGSHGMDIMSPVRAISDDYSCIRSTDKQVMMLNLIFIEKNETSNHLVLWATDNNQLLWTQGKEVNLFQPASEFLPMIEEVNKSFVLKDYYFYLWHYSV